MDKKWFFKRIGSSDVLTADATWCVVDFANRNRLRPGELIILLSVTEINAVEIMYFAEKEMK